VGLKDKDVRVIMSMLVLCNANDIVGYYRSRYELPSAPLDMGYGNNSESNSHSSIHKHET